MQNEAPTPLHINTSWGCVTLIHHPEHKSMDVEFLDRTRKKSLIRLRLSTAYFETLRDWLVSELRV